MSSVIPSFDMKALTHDTVSFLSKIRSLCIRPISTACGSDAVLRYATKSSGVAGVEACSLDSLVPSMPIECTDEDDEFFWDISERDFELDLALFDGDRSPLLNVKVRVRDLLRFDSDAAFSSVSPATVPVVPVSFPDFEPAEPQMEDWEELLVSPFAVSRPLCLISSALTFASRPLIFWRWFSGIFLDT